MKDVFDDDELSYRKKKTIGRWLLDNPGKTIGLGIVVLFFGGWWLGSWVTDTPFNPGAVVTDVTTAVADGPWQLSEGIAYRVTCKGETSIDTNVEPEMTPKGLRIVSYHRPGYIYLFTNPSCLIVTKQ